MLKGPILTVRLLSENRSLWEPKGKWVNCATVGATLSGETWEARAFIGKLEKGNQAECLMLLKKLTELLHISPRKPYLMFDNSPNYYLTRLPNRIWTKKFTNCIISTVFQLFENGRRFWDFRRGNFSPLWTHIWALFAILMSVFNTYTLIYSI